MLTQPQIDKLIIKLRSNPNSAESWEYITETPDSVETMKYLLDYGQAIGIANYYANKSSHSKAYSFWASEIARRSTILANHMWYEAMSYHEKVLESRFEEVSEVDELSPLPGMYEYLEDKEK